MKYVTRIKIYDGGFSPEKLSDYGVCDILGAEIIRVIGGGM